MTKILVLYYSSYGHTERMAQAAADGARAANAQVDLRRVPELVPTDVARKSGIKLDQDAPIAAIDELPSYDGIVFGTPTRFGNMCAQMRNFLDQTGGLWASGALVGKVASVFTSTATQHGGQETTITSFHTTLLHHGMVIVGIPYAQPELNDVSEMLGGSPYGAATITGGDGKLQPKAKELALVRAQGKRVAEIAAKLAARDV